MKISKRLYFTCENINYNLITSAFPVHFPQPTSDFKTLQAIKFIKCGYSCAKLDRKGPFGNLIVKMC